MQLGLLVLSSELITLRTAFSVFTAFAISFSLCPAAEEDGKPSAERAVKLHKMTAEDFAKIEKLNMPIDFENIDLALLDAAVFHETNRQRSENELPALDFEPALREAATVQVRGMIRMQAISHSHPDADKKTQEDRFDLLGIDTMMRAENVALVFGIRYESGTEVYKRKKAGRMVYSAKPNGTPIQPHTYASFSENLLENWMASPGHRRNILTKGLKTLGTSSLHDRSALGMDAFYSAQEFGGKVTVREE